MRKKCFHFVFTLKYLYMCLGMIMGTFRGGPYLCFYLEICLSSPFRNFSSCPHLCFYFCHRSLFPISPENLNPCRYLWIYGEKKSKKRKIIYEKILKLNKILINIHNPFNQKKIYNLL